VNKATNEERNTDLPVLFNDFL